MPHEQADETLPVTFVVACDLILGLALLARRDDDPIDNLIQLGVSQANVRHITANLSEQLQYGAASDNPADAVRAPIRVLALSRTLNLPFETVRRRTTALCRSGRLVATPEGLLAPAARFGTPEHLQALLAIDRLAADGFRRLDAAGFFGPGDIATPEVAPDAPPLRATGRLMGDYYLRMLAPLRDWAGDPIDALLLLSLHRHGVRQEVEATGAPTDPVRQDRDTSVRPRHVARTLGLPQETVRRRMLRLVEAGRCRLSEGGYQVPIAALATGLLPRFEEFNALNLRRMYRVLSQLGAAAGWRGAV
jgi:hypothetical protein